jgi:alkylation response protein AidB-like acyl-CoA dehydrogenase
MELSYSEEQAMFRDSLNRYLDDLGPVKQLRVLRDAGDPRGFVEESWAQMVGQGWPGVTSSINHGGSEMGQMGLGLIMEAVGRTLCPTPLEATVVMGIAWLENATLTREHLGVLRSAISGEMLLTLALQEGAHFKPSEIETLAIRDGDRIMLIGQKSNVLDAAIADKIIVVAHMEGRLCAFLVDAGTPGVVVGRGRSIDSRHVGDIRFTDVVVPVTAMIGMGDAGDTLAAVEDVVAAQTAAQLFGISQQVFAMTCEYLRTREQFGVKIGTFQALQHRAAALYVELEMSRALVRAALSALDEKSADASALASAAKVKLCRTSRLAVNEAIQMHGGVGVTDELNLGLYLKRAMALQHLFGDANYHINRFARLRSY